MKVLVCGGRDYAGYSHVWGVLETIHARTPIDTLIEGGATGADHWARKWAKCHHGVEIETHPADWQAHGRAAGPLRNQRMLDVGNPNLVIAFPGGRGTADMVRRAKRAGVKLVEYAA